MGIAINWVKVVIVNILIFIILALFIEIGLRVAWSLMDCFSQDCDFSKFTNLKISDDSLNDKSIGMSKRNQILGYTVAPGFSEKINTKSWKDNFVTIDIHGFRTNDGASLKKTILAVGDSYTFGAQVSNHETWPACVERKMNVGVANAGVFGYGATQSVLRASIEIEKKDFEAIIWSVLVIDDFKRDQLIYRSGFPKPTVIEAEDGTLKLVAPPNEDLAGSKYGEK